MRGFLPAKLATSEIRARLRVLVIVSVGSKFAVARSRSNETQG